MTNEGQSNVQGTINSGQATPIAWFSNCNHQWAPNQLAHFQDSHASWSRWAPPEARRRKANWRIHLENWSKEINAPWPTSQYSFWSLSLMTDTVCYSRCSELRKINISCLCLCLSCPAYPIPPYHSLKPQDYTKRNTIEDMIHSIIFSENIQYFIKKTEL